MSHKYLVLSTSVVRVRDGACARFWELPIEIFIESGIIDELNCLLLWSRFIFLFNIQK